MLVADAIVFKTWRASTPEPGCACSTPSKFKPMVYSVVPAVFAAAAWLIASFVHASALVGQSVHDPPA